MYATNITWMPDSKALLYKDGFRGVWLQRLNEQKPERPPGLDDKEIYLLTWSPDGKDLAYSTGARMQEIILLQDAR